MPSERSEVGCGKVSIWLQNGDLETDLKSGGLGWRDHECDRFRRATPRVPSSLAEPRRRRRFPPPDARGGVALRRGGSGDRVEGLRACASLDLALRSRL